MWDHHFWETLASKNLQQPGVVLGIGYDGPEIVHLDERLMPKLWCLVVDAPGPICGYSDGTGICCCLPRHDFPHIRVSHKVARRFRLLITRIGSWPPPKDVQELIGHSGECCELL